MNNPEPASARTRLAELSYSKIWWSLTTAIAVALILGLGALQVIRFLALPLAVLIFALTLAAALDPLVVRVQHRMSRLPAILLTYLGIVILLAALRVLVRQVIAPAIRRQTGAEPPERIPT